MACASLHAQAQADNAAFIKILSKLGCFPKISVTKLDEMGPGLAAF